MRSPRAIVAILCLALLGCGRVQAARQAGQAPVSTLIVYVYAEVCASRLSHAWRRLASAPERRSRPQTDQESRHNLQFFLDHGVRANDGAHYVIVIQADDTSQARTSPPAAGPRRA